MSDITVDELNALYYQREELNKQIADAEHHFACQGKSVLDLPLLDNDAKAATVRDYLKALLTRIWEEGEGFNGKRPFGKSGWDCELTSAIQDAGLAASEEEAQSLVFEAIEQL